MGDTFYRALGKSLCCVSFTYLHFFLVLFYSTEGETPELCAN